MATILHDLQQKAAQLPRNERLELVRSLLIIDEPKPSKEIDASWEAEILARIEAYRDGSESVVDYSAFRAEMNSQVSR